MRLTHAIALVSLITAACGTPCRDRKVAFIAAGGPIGILAAALDQCSDEPQPPPEPTPIAAVPIAGLSEQPTPDLGSPPDMAEPRPDLSPLVCGLGTVLDGQFCSPDGDGDGVPDRQDQCKTLSAGQSPDPARRGCPAPRVYQVILPAAAFAVGGNIDLHNGVATSRPDYDWANTRHAPATLSSIIFFQNGSSNVTNAVSFELVGVADFTAPLTTLDPCAAFKDNLHQDAATMGRDVACVARRIDLCPVDIVSPTSRLFGEAECARFVGGGGGFVSKANAPIKLTASVASADWRSSEPMPVAGIEVQIVMGGNVSLANFQVIATIKETLH